MFEVITVHDWTKLVDTCWFENQIFDHFMEWRAGVTWVKHHAQQETRMGQNKPRMANGGYSRREGWKDWPPLHGLPYGLLHGLPYGLPLQITLKILPNPFYGVQKYKKLTCSSYTIITARKTAAIFFSYIFRPSLFHFAPFFTGWPPARTLFPQWTIGKCCWIFIFVICLKCLPSTLTFANKQLFWIFLPSRELEIIEIDTRTETTNRWTKSMLW